MNGWRIVANINLSSLSRSLFGSGNASECLKRGKTTSGGGGRKIGGNEKSYKIGRAVFLRRVRSSGWRKNLEETRGLGRLALGSQRAFLYFSPFLSLSSPRAGLAKGKKGANAINKNGNKWGWLTLAGLERVHRVTHTDSHGVEEEEKENKQRNRARVFGSRRKEKAREGRARGRM